MKLAISFFAILAITTSVHCATKLQEVFAWNILDWAYPNDAARMRDILTKRFVPENALPVGIEIWNDKLFVSVPRWEAGIPATLNYIPMGSHAYTKSPQLIPYPSWESNELGKSFQN